MAKVIYGPSFDSSGIPPTALVYTVIIFSQGKDDIPANASRYAAPPSVVLVAFLRAQPGQNDRRDRILVHGLEGVDFVAERGEPEGRFLLRIPHQDAGYTESEGILLLPESPGKVIGHLAFPIREEENVRVPERLIFQQPQCLLEGLFKVGSAAAEKVLGGLQYLLQGIDSRKEQIRPAFLRIGKVDQRHGPVLPGEDAQQGKGNRLGPDKLGALHRAGFVQADNGSSLPHRGFFPELMLLEPPGQIPLHEHRHRFPAGQQDGFGGEKPGQIPAVGDVIVFSLAVPDGIFPAFGEEFLQPSDIPADLQKHRVFLQMPPQDGIDLLCDFLSEHWTRIRTNNVIERLNREFRRCTRVVGTFPDDNSALMLVCARLRHVAGTQWGNKKYMNMKHLEATVEDAFIAD